MANIECKERISGTLDTVINWTVGRIYATDKIYLTHIVRQEHVEDYGRYE